LAIANTSNYYPMSNTQTFAEKYSMQSKPNSALARLLGSYPSSLVAVSHLASNICTKRHTNALVSHCYLLIWI